MVGSNTNVAALRSEVCMKSSEMILAIRVLMYELCMRMAGFVSALGLRYDQAVLGVIECVYIYIYVLNHQNHLNHIYIYTYTYVYTLYTCICVQANGKLKPS